MLKEIIKENQISWYDEQMDDPRMEQIQKILRQLEDTELEYSVKWGAGFLVQNCSHDLKEKYLRQCDKFKAAIVAKDENKVRDLAMGFKRAYKALEADVMEKSLTPSRDYPVMHWQDEETGKTGVIVPSIANMKVEMAIQHGKDVEIFTLQEYLNDKFRSIK